MKRQKFVTRKWLLKTEKQRDSLMVTLPNLPLDDVHPIEIVAREEAKARGLDANGYYWLRLGEIASQAWFNGRQYIADVWHEYAKRHLMQEQVTLKDGTVRSKWIEAPDGTLTVISTTLLEKGCFAEYCTIVEAFGADLGVQFSANPRERAA